jgi:mannose-6-phosphate isomerase
MSSRPFRLVPSFREKIWGVTDLEPWFRLPSGRIGEVWFLHPDGEHLPVLVKFIFTSERLSIQVHPGDAYALEHDGIPGKTEMWHILRAEPGAQLALGLRETVSRERLRESAVSGEIERLLRWFPVNAGETYFVPPGTVHALGPGIVLCEIQQNSDNTYRLYDYGRPRELHLDKALDVATRGPHSGASEIAGNRLGACDSFVVDRLEIESTTEHPMVAESFHQLVVLDGSGSIGQERFSRGEVWMAPRGCDPLTIQPDSHARLLLISGTGYTTSKFVGP